MTALAAFTAAAALTYWVTNVRGKLPTFAIVTNQSHLPKEVQIISIYTGSPDSPISEIRGGVRYFADGRGLNKPTLLAYLAPRADVMFFLNNLADGDKVCTGGIETDDDKRREPLAAVRVAETPETYGVVWRVKPPPSDMETVVECRLVPAWEQHTFSRKLMYVSFPAAEEAWLTTAEKPASAQTPSARPAASTMQKPQPVAPTLLTFADESADLYTFASVHGKPEGVFGSSTRIFTAGSSFLITWNNARHEQLRDLIFVIIGTLIAVFVHATIEAIKVRFEPTSTAVATQTPSAARPGGPPAVEPGPADADLP